MGGRRMSEVRQQDLFNENDREKEIASINRLFQDVKRYRKSREFIRMLNFYASFPYLGVYNAALVEQQRPGAKMVLTVKKWSELYKRKIKQNARPVIILLPFYPVEFLFDIYDTKPIGKYNKEEDNYVIEQIINSHKAECKSEVWFYLANLEDNLSKYGIAYHSNYVVGSEIQAQIKIDDSEEIYVRLNKDHIVTHNSHFILSVRAGSSKAEQLACIFHELGHLFCQHLSYTWFKDRSYTDLVKEFEAETVSYLVCSRIGIRTHSMEYLAAYINENEEIPPVDIQRIFDAVDLIEQIIKGNRDVTKCLLYKKDKAFKEKVDKEKEQIRKEKENATKESF
jgi:hypothetical protein